MQLVEYNFTINIFLCHFSPRRVIDRYLWGFHSIHPTEKHTVYTLSNRVYIICKISQQCNDTYMTCTVHPHQSNTSVVYMLGETLDKTISSSRQSLLSKPTYRLLLQTKAYLTRYMVNIYASDTMLKCISVLVLNVTHVTPVSVMPKLCSAGQWGKTMFTIISTK